MSFSSYENVSTMIFFHHAKLSGNFVRQFLQFVVTYILHIIKWNHLLRVISVIMPILLCNQITKVDTVHEA